MQNELLYEKLNYVFNALEMHETIAPLMENQEFNKIRAIISAKSDYINNQIDEYRHVARIRGNTPQDDISTLINMSQVYNDLEDYFMDKAIELC